MKTAQTLLNTLLLTLTLLLLSACSSKPLIKDSTMEVKAKESVAIEAIKGYDSYSWRQISGISVEIADVNSSTLRFIAPVVTQKQELKFELRATLNNSTREAQVTVIVLPINEDADSDTNPSAGDDDTNSTVSDSSGDDNTTVGGSDNNTTGGNDDNSTTGGGTDSNTSNPITALKLTMDKTSINKDGNTTLKVEVIYSDNSSKEVTDKVEWIIKIKESIEIIGNILIAKDDYNTTIQAKYQNKLSNKINLEIYWEVRGHRLPPRPDKTLNDSTLLGIDVNHNGVRDDVERWIYNRYKDKHPIYIDIAMQEARADRLILEKQPKTKVEAMEIKDEVDKPIHCQSYYKYYSEYFNEPILIKENVADEYFRSKIYFNTKERMEVYDQYDTLLSGDSYTLPKITELKSLCDFNTSKYDKE